MLSLPGHELRDGVLSSSTSFLSHVKKVPPEPFRLGVVCDYPEEGWVSMDLCAEMLDKHLSEHFSERVQVTRLCPPFRRRASRFPILGRQKAALNADRAANRFWDYPRWLRTLRDDFDLFHVIDHSYAHLVHSLPAKRTVVTCNDLNAFSCLLNPKKRPSRLFQRMTRHILSGMQSAARVACISQATTDQLRRHDLIPSDRSVSVPLAADPVFSPVADPAVDEAAAQLLRSKEADTLHILHVGSTIPRKRIDVLLNVFAALKKSFPNARLIRAGGQFTGEQLAMVQRLGLQDAIDVLPFIERDVLAAVYRRATIVVQPSEAEGFGLPIIEALACGAPVVASDLAVLREVGGTAATFCPVGDVKAWSRAVKGLLDERTANPNRWAARPQAALAQAKKFSWHTYATTMMQMYADVLQAAGNGADAGSTVSKTDDLRT